MKKHARTLRLAGVIVFGVVAAGCGSVSSRVPVSPVRGQSDVQTGPDAARCEAVATAGGRTDRERHAAFAACMAASGYRVSVPVRIGIEHARVAVEPAAQRSAAQVQADLRACEAQVEDVSIKAGRPSAAVVVAGTIGGLSGGDLTQARAHGTSKRLGEDFATCLVSRGYNATPEP